MKRMRNDFDMYRRRGVNWNETSRRKFQMWLFLRDSDVVALLEDRFADQNYNMSIFGVFHAIKIIQHELLDFKETVVLSRMKETLREEEVIPVSFIDKFSTCVQNARS